MKALILAAGFGTRLERDIRDDDSQEFVHLLGVPKPLVPISNRFPHLIDYLVNMIESCSKIDDIFVVTNDYNYSYFKLWAKNKDFPLENIINDGTNSNENRLGAIADIHLVIKQKKIADDLLIVGGDTLFYPSFDLDRVLDDFYAKNGSTIVCSPVSDEEVSKRGIIERDLNQKIISFLEKPSLKETSSRDGVPCFYLYQKEAINLLSDYLNQTTVLKERDAPGMFLAWLYEKVPVYGFDIEGRFDIGNLEDYKKTIKSFSEVKL